MVSFEWYATLSASYHFCNGTTWCVVRLWTLCRAMETRLTFPPFTLHPQLQFRPVMTGASLRLLLVIPQGFSRSSLWWVSPFSSRTADIRWQGSVSYLLNTQDLSRWIKEIEHAPENQKCLMFLSELHSQTISVALKDKVSFLNAKCIFRGGQLWWPLRQREI